MTEELRRFIVRHTCGHASHYPAYRYTKEVSKALSERLCISCNNREQLGIYKQKQEQPND